MRILNRSIGLAPRGTQLTTSERMWVRFLAGVAPLDSWKAENPASINYRAQVELSCCIEKGKRKFPHTLARGRIPGEQVLRERELIPCATGQDDDFSCFPVRNSLTGGLNSNQRQHLGIGCL